MSHNHNHCKHELKYCDECDVAYCVKCGREWGGHKYYWYYPQYTLTTDRATITDNSTWTWVQPGKIEEPKTACSHH